jgi:hypothetical protein
VPLLLALGLWLVPADVIAEHRRVLERRDRAHAARR